MTEKDRSDLIQLLKDLQHILERPEEYPGTSVARHQVRRALRMASLEDIATEQHNSAIPRTK